MPSALATVASQSFKSNMKTLNNKTHKKEPLYRNIHQHSSSVSELPFGSILLIKTDSS